MAESELAVLSSHSARQGVFEINEPLKDEVKPAWEEERNAKHAKAELAVHDR